MKFVTLLFSIVVFEALARNVSALADHHGYTTKYDGINIEDILNSTRLMDNYCKCLLDLGKCTAAGDELKSHIIEALQTNCKECSEKQTAEIPRVILHMRRHYRDMCYDPLISKYDPNGEFQKKYKDELESLQ